MSGSQEKPCRLKLGPTQQLNGRDSEEPGLLNAKGLAEAAKQEKKAGPLKLCLKGATVFGRKPALPETTKVFIQQYLPLGFGVGVPSMFGIGAKENKGEKAGNIGL